ncbi:MAG: protein-disulfide reductase DsbD family protein [Bacteroidetes bacterium]|nr:protein-disulfide reductase DsbD family protein [Bacteroidota bacterium]
MIHRLKNIFTKFFSLPIKKAAVFALLLFIGSSSFSQILNPAKWTFSIEQSSKEEATLVFNVKLDKAWHIYSQFTPDGGPLPMVYKFEPNDCYQLSGKVTEPKPHVEFDSTFGVKVWLFTNEATFKQKVKLKKEGCRIQGTVDYEACKESCIFSDTSFVFDFGKIKTSKLSPVNADPDTLKKSSQNPPDTAHAVLNPVPGDSSFNHSDPGNEAQLEQGCGSDEVEIAADKSYIGIFIAGMLGGFLALLTPCVFPMIPMTVSFFTKRSGSRKKGLMNALIYAASIIGIYVSLGLIVTVSFGSDALNDLASNGFFNLTFFVIFIIFAISFFGAFEITLPSSWVNKADHASDRGGLIGIFFMAFTLCLVSFSCTGPIIGTLLVEAAHGRSYIGPAAGMSGFAFALALPFALFAMFPSWLNSLPKSGGWLNTVKVTLGFIELALALKFLSNVDLAYHWGFLKREIFVVIWIVIFSLLGFYMLGKIRFAHDSETGHVSIGRFLFALFSFSFALYLTPGIWGAPLKLISGFPPPEFYKEWKTNATDCPHDLNCFHDLTEGMNYAKAQGKPVMIDFTGWSCVNCRKMEDNVWSDPKVLNRLSNNYVLVSLYVDDKELLPADQQTVSATTGRKIKTTGNKWSDLQASVYKTNSQPYYVLLDNNGKLLAKPRGYTPAIKTYLDYLDEGLCRYKKRNSSK